MGISMGHLIIVLVIVLLLFGPSRLEGLGNSLGKSIRGFKKGLEGHEDEAKELDHEVNEKVRPKKSKKKLP